MTQNIEDLKLSSYFYELPKQLIASHQLQKRDESKLLVYKKRSNQIVHTTFKYLPDHLTQSQLLVFNNSKVFPCRILGRKKSGAEVEIFLLDINSDKDQLYKAMIRSSKKKKIGDEYVFSNAITARLEQINDDQTFKLGFSRPITEELLEQIGMIPIPPYIRDGQSLPLDKTTYQTIYAKHTGSVAAPTAGLHFTNDLFTQLENRGIDKAFVTLHVGPGTFLPVKVDQIEQHKMHYEKYFVNESNLKKIKEAQDIIAVGTTSLRVLESMQDKTIVPDQLYETDIFLYPGKPIHSIKGIITNFHLPESSLIMLVSCLIGRKKVMELYQEAIKHEYRFYSYGDAMLILLDE